MFDLSNITAVILAGGLGTRIQSTIGNEPKVMAKINNKPFLYYVLDQLSQIKIERVIICTGYKAQKVENIIGCSYNNMVVDFSREEKPLGTAGALKHAEKLFDTKYCLVMNGDSYVDYDFNAFFSSHLKKKVCISILVTNVENSSRYGSIIINQNNIIKKFIEKSKHPSQGLINAGVYLFNKSSLRKIPDKKICSLENDFFPFMLNTNIHGFITEGDFIDIGTHKSYHRAQSFFIE